MLAKIFSDIYTRDHSGARWTDAADIMTQWMQEKQVNREQIVYIKYATVQSEYPSRETLNQVFVLVEGVID